MRIPMDLPPGLNDDDTQYANQGRWADGSNVRFRLGRPQVIGGWESLVSTLLTGVCRAIFPWTDNSAVQNIAFGTHSNLQVWRGGALYDITPFGAPVRLASAPLTTANGAAVVTVAHVAHGFTTGLSLKIFGALDVGGIVAANLNGTRTITVTGVDAYTFTAGANATSTVTGGGTNVVVTPQTVLPAGAIDGTGGAGWGTGGYGIGGYSQPSTADFFPRTWSFGAWGQNLLASVRGGGLYQWSNVTATRAVAVDNAPTQISDMLVAPINGGYMAFALGCNEEVAGTFNPMCIRHSAIRALTSWSTATSTSREYILTGGGRIIAGRMIGPYLGVWTSDSFWLGSYTGSLINPWDFQRQGTKCGLIGPKAVVVVGQTAFWASPDRQFYAYGLGGSPGPVECPIRSDFAEFLAAAQGDKVTASSCAEFSEIRFDYPDSRDGYENSRYVAAHVPTLESSPANAWYRGTMARTAMVDAGPSAYPVATTFAGASFYHEKGHAADGSAFAWFIRSAAQLFDVDYRLQINSVWPDFQGQIGPVTVAITSREHPQGDDTTVTAPPMAPNDQKADILITGRLFEIEFSGNSTPTDARLGRPVIEYQRAGKL